MTAPSSESPPVLLTLDYSDPQGASTDPMARFEDGQLKLRAPGPNTFRGLAADNRSYRDVILDTQISLTAGTPDDLFGVFVRQSSEQSFVFWGVTLGRRCLIGVADGTFTPVVNGQLAPDMKLGGMGEPNRFQVVAIGPALAFVLNGMVVSGFAVDPRYKEGPVGYYLHRLTDAEAEIAVDWVQLRAVLPPG